ncbi:MAG TPA: hypothetical protein VFU88_15095, partial [Ktedonobacterales bacterium]|nr:hypothetical protein [Ktedonobacterales bacterium]
EAASASSSAGLLPGQQAATYPAPSGFRFNFTTHIAPSSGPGGLAYACWLQFANPHRDGDSGALQLAVLDPHARRWNVLVPPAAAAVRCEMIAGSGTQDAALLILHDEPSDATTCGLPRLFVTADRGASWQPVSWPSATVSNCHLTYALVGDTLYIASAEPLLPSAAGVAGGIFGRLLVSADLGRSWRAADAGLAQFPGFTTIAFRAGGGILAQTSQRVPLKASMLWESDDAGRTWRWLGVLPGTSPRVYASTDASRLDRSGWGRLYLSSSTSLGAGADANGSYFATAVIPPALTLAFTSLTVPGLRWMPVSPPPIGGDLRGGAFAELTASAAEGPDQSLLYLESIGSAPPFLTPAYRVWAWHPATGRWSSSRFRISWNTRIQGVAWDNGQLNVWLEPIGGLLTSRVRALNSAIAVQPAT